jgi:predicted DNA-binding transcriptional regulator
VASAAAVLACADPRNYLHHALKLVSPHNNKNKQIISYLVNKKMEEMRIKAIQKELEEDKPEEGM